MHALTNTLPVSVKVGANSSLAELIVVARDAHRNASSANSTVTKHGLVAGRALNEMKDRKLVHHRQWTKVYGQCAVGKRQAQKYRRLARLVDANANSESFLIAGLSIEDAIRKLAPPKFGSPNKTNKPGSKIKKSDALAKPTASHTDILAVWIKALPETHRHAVDAIGLVAWLDAVPPAWIPQLQQLLAERCQPVIDIGATAAPAQAPVTNTEQPDDEPAGEPDDEPEPDVESELKFKTRPKFVEYDFKEPKRFERNFERNHMLREMRAAKRRDARWGSPIHST